MWLSQNFYVNADEQYVKLLLHTDVCWLSKGNCLERVVNLFNTIGIFLQTERHSNSSSKKEHTPS